MFYLFLWRIKTVITSPAQSRRSAGRLEQARGGDKGTQGDGYLPQSPYFFGGSKRYLLQRSSATTATAAKATESSMGNTHESLMGKRLVFIP